MVSHVELLREVAEERSRAMASESERERSRTMASSSGFLYSGISSNAPAIQTHLVNQMQQGFDSNPDLFNLTAGIEMLGFPSRYLEQKELGFLGKSSSSKTINEHRGDFYHPQYSKQDFSSGFTETMSENLIVAPDFDDSSLRCVFSCERNEKPCQGLSLSLSSDKPSSVEVKSFELRETSRLLHHQDRIFGKASSSGLYQTQFQLKNSKYLAPAQQLLNEFCNLGTTKQTDTSKAQKPRKTNQLEDENGYGSSSRKQSLYSLEVLELQKRKAKLLSMLDEVDRRYNHYCDQMKSVVLSFEAVAGNGSATVYTALASKAMSRHFRNLRDGIVSQILVTKKVLGDKDTVAPGTTRGETPRLRVLDQTLRKQKAFQQMGMMESHPWRPQRGLPERSVSVLRAWLFEHFLHPYPSDVDKHILARQTGLSRSQVSNWFINARVRLWKPMVEEMYIEETKDQYDIASSSDGITVPEDQNDSPILNPDQTRLLEDQKPTVVDQIIRIDPESLSSIINDINTSTGSHESYHHQNLETFGVVDLDFSSYSHHQTTSNVSYNQHGIHQNFCTGVSLTLGLQQHGGSAGGSRAFSPPSSQHSFFFPRDHIEDCQPVPYSILDGEEAENLPYRDLMGTQVLHDLAG